MNRCSSPDHPHCTVWVMPGDAACAHGHAQPAVAEGAPPPVSAPSTAAEPLESSFAMLGRLRAAPDGHPHLHISGFDPRAAGGRQTIKLELRGMPEGVPGELTMLLQSDLLPGGAARQVCARSLHGAWRPLFVEFSSRGREHGQYRIDIELHARADGHPGLARTWVCTLVLLVPRADASLGEIHQTFLATHKNVRIHADDASIARLHGLDAAGSLDLDIHAGNASIAQLDLGAIGAGAGGGIDVALPTIAWDEDLIEIGQSAPARPRPRAGQRNAPAHPFPAAAACLVHAEPDAGAPRHLRLFAFEECVLGRLDDEARTTAAPYVEPEADLLLQHYGEHGPEADGLTRRLSARHAVMRWTGRGFEIEDVSRYGILLDGVWPGKGAPTALRLGMRIEFTASIRGVATLVVSALLPHGAVLHRVDAGGAAEAFMLLAPALRPTLPATQHALPRAAGLPLLFHRDGGFWHLDPATGAETALDPATNLAQLAGIDGRVRFAGGPRPEDWVERQSTAERIDRRRPPSLAASSELPVAPLRA